MYEKFRRLPCYFILKEGGIWMKEKVQSLKIINALFLEPHTRCYALLSFTGRILDPAYLIFL